MHKILRQISTDWEYQKINNPENRFSVLQCGHCNITVMFVKINQECSDFNCCLECLPLYQKTKIVIKDLSSGCFDFDIEKRAFNGKSYNRYSFVNFLVNRVGLHEIVKHLKATGKIDASPISTIIETKPEQMLGITYVFDKPNSIGSRYYPYKLN